MCASDAHVVKGTLPGRYPLVLGHEGAGIVESVGPRCVNSLSVGDHVVLSFIAPCGTCQV